MSKYSEDEGVPVGYCTILSLTAAPPYTSVSVYTIFPLEDFLGYLWHTFFPVTNTCMQEKARHDPKHVLLHLCHMAELSAHYGYMQAFWVLSSVLSSPFHLEHFKQHVTNFAPGKITNFQSLFKVSRQKLMLFWEAVRTGTLYCIYAPSISP